MSEREILVHTPDLTALPETLRGQLRKLCARTGRRVRAAGTAEIQAVWDAQPPTARLAPAGWPNQPALVFSPRFGDRRDFGELRKSAEASTRV